MSAASRRVEQTTGIVPFGRLVNQVMKVEAPPVCTHGLLVVDNGSSHAGKTSIKRMTEACPNARLIHLPVHASWLNQIEIYFSIVQRKAPTRTTEREISVLTQHERVTHQRPQCYLVGIDDTSGRCIGGRDKPGITGQRSAGLGANCLCDSVGSKRSCPRFGMSEGSAGGHAGSDGLRSP